MLPYPRQSPPQQQFYERLPGELVAVTCYFNPCNYQSLKRNYKTFAAEIRRQGIALYSAEVAYGDEPFFLAEDEFTLRLRSNDVLWQKERILNLLIARLPDTVDKVAWLDADLLFTNHSWARECRLLLEQYPVVQLFDTAIHLTRSGGALGSRTGVAALATRSPELAKNFGVAHPGFAWAARRSLLLKHGLLQNVIVGCCDGLMVMGMNGWWDNPLVACYNRPMRASFLEWGQAIFCDVQGQVGFVRGDLLHLWHGSLANRKYVERISYLNEHHFDPEVDIAVAPEGAWRWASDKPKMHARVEAYFFERQDDD
jgi:hypothetical protein